MDDGSCIYPGCTDTLACNYDALAGCDDGSCSYPIPGYDCNGICLGANACECPSSCNSSFTNINYEHITNVNFAGINNSSAGNTGGPVDYTDSVGAVVVQGATEPMSVTLYLSSAYTEYIYAWFDWNQNGSFADSGEYYLVAGPVTTVGPHTGSINVPANALLGTTRMRVMMDYNNAIPDPCRSATYGEWAEDYCVTVTAGSSGCTDSTALNYDPTASIDDGSCVYSTAISILSPADGSDFTSCSSDSLSIDFTVSNFVVDTSGADGHIHYYVNGAMTMKYDMSSILLSNLANGSYEVIMQLVDNAHQPLIPNVADTVNFNVNVIYGCTDSTASNYDPLSTCDDGSCTYCVWGCTNPVGQINYNAAATCDDGSCIPIVYGCTDPTALNYNSSANVNDGSCIFCVYGCTDTTAFNYSAAATCDDGSCIAVVYGCTDATACNYYAGANVDDGSCEWTSCASTCTAPDITGLSVSSLIHDRVTLNFDNMNSYDATGAQVCRVDQIRIKYREVGTSSWSQKNMASPTGTDPVTGICNSTQNTSKLVLNLTPSTTYEWKLRYGTVMDKTQVFVPGPDFTTLAACPNVANLAVTSPNTTKATFTWDASNGSYSFVRLKARPEVTSDPINSWFNIGGMGVAYGTNTKDKNNLTPGESYRGQARTWCDPNGGPYRATTWSPLVFWTQPTTIRLEGSDAIANLDVYPNPSRDVFNVAFTSEEVQDLDVRVVNVVGEVIYTENLEQFVGEYTKAIDLATYTKGVYFLEITTDNGVVNKKLILQ